MCFSLFCRLMRRENGLYLSPMMRHLQKSNTVLLSARNQDKELGSNGSPMNDKSFLMFRRSLMIRYGFTPPLPHPLQESSADSATGTIFAASEGSSWRGN